MNNNSKFFVLIFQVLHLSFFRISAMALSLAAVIATYHVLSARDFALFNMVLFFIAIGTSLSQPLNRVFWAGNSEANFSLSSYGSALVTVAIAAPGVAISTMARDHSAGTLALTALAAGIYGAARVFERYAYGRLLVAGYVKTSVLPILTFAILDLGVVGGMLLSGNSSIAVRLIVPPVLFLGIIALSSFVPNVPGWAGRIPALGDLFAFMKQHTVSRTGFGVLFLGALMTAASMIDRPFLYLFPLASDATVAAYLLALSYTIALQTLLSLLFDMARAHIYREGRWLAGARRGTMLILGFSAATLLTAWAVHPVLIYLGLLPSEVHWIMWGALLARSLVLVLANILNVDHFQDGRVRDILISGFVVLIAVLIAVGLLSLGYSQTIAGMILGAICGLVIAEMTIQFFRRVPVL